MKQDQKLMIQGGNPLFGEVTISGSKNAALPLMIAVATSQKPVTLLNVPNISDIRLVCQILEKLGCKVVHNLKEKNSIQFDPRHIGEDLKEDIQTSSEEHPFYNAGSIRASTLFAGALLGKLKKVEIPLPGGDAIGKRPIDMHIAGFEKMGAKVSITSENTVIFEIEDHLKPCHIDLPFPSVGATQNLMMAAVHAKGTVVIEGAAREPEIINLSELLNALGATVKGAGTSKIEITGTTEFQSAEVKIIPDRIELFTFLCAAGLTQGDILCCNVFSNVLAAETQFLEDVGIQLVWSNDTLRAIAPKDGLKPFKLKTGPFPEFPTDNQPMALALATHCQGQSHIEETMFENRYMHADELIKMNANIKHNKTEFYIEGTKDLLGADVKIHDIRAGACLVLAALVAKGESRLTDVHHILRGYQNMDEKLRKLGAQIQFTQSE